MKDDYGPEESQLPSSQNKYCHFPDCERPRLPEADLCEQHNNVESINEMHS